MNIIVLQGGPSSEAEVSRRSGNNIAQTLKENHHTVTQVEFSREALKEILADPPDIVFMAMHGTPGEDGTVQGFLEAAGIPFTHSGSAAAALAIDKLRTKQIMLQTGVPTLPFILVRKGDIIPAKAEAAIHRCGLPFIVKPLREGSSVGITIVKEREHCAGIIEMSVNAYSAVLIEPFIGNGREVTVGIAGRRGEETTLPILELRTKEAFYDYHAKYTPGQTEFICPAPLLPRLKADVEAIAVQTHTALGCTAPTRIDMIIQEHDIRVLEVNTIPGMTLTSDYPYAAQVAGKSFTAVCDDIITWGLQRSHSTRGHCAAYL